MATGLAITLADGATLWWPQAEIRQTQGGYAGEEARLERGAVPETLVVADPGFLAALRAATSGRRFRAPARRTTAGMRTGVAALATIAIAVALYLWGIPTVARLVAVYVPVSWEERLGATVMTHLAPTGRRCVDAERGPALEAILARLLASVPDQPYTFRLTVVDDPGVNAFAAPGGYIVVLRGLLERSRSPEELAGVLAHEVQHVLRRHTTRALLQHASTGLLVAAVSGDVSGVMAYGVESARVLGALRYSRQAEEEADMEGMRMLLASRVDPRGMLAFFESTRATTGAGALTRYLSSHPSSDDRVHALARLAATAPSATPLLADRDWADVVKMCSASRRTSADPPSVASRS